MTSCLPRLTEATRLRTIAKRVAIVCDARPMLVMPTALNEDLLAPGSRYGPNVSSGVPTFSARLVAGLWEVLHACAGFMHYFEEDGDPGVRDNARVHNSRVHSPCFSAH